MSFILQIKRQVRSNISPLYSYVHRYIQSSMFDRLECFMISFVLSVGKDKVTFLWRVHKFGAHWWESLVPLHDTHQITPSKKMSFQSVKKLVSPIFRVFLHRWCWWGSSLQCLRMFDTLLHPARVCKVTFKFPPQPLKGHMRSFGTLGKIFSISPLLSTHKLHSKWERGGTLLGGLNPNIC